MQNIFKKMWSTDLTILEVGEVERLYGYPIKNTESTLDNLTGT